MISFKKSSSPQEKIFVVYGQTADVVDIVYDEPEENTIEDVSVNETLASLSTLCNHYSDEQLKDCIESSMSESLSRFNSHQESVATSRDQIADRLRNYTCADESLQTSPAIEVHDIEIDEKIYTINTLLNFSHSKIYYVNNFVSDEECDTLVEFGLPRLQRATVAGDDGLSTVSENRKAQQASYPIHMQKRGEDPLWPLYNRVMNMTNLHTGLHLEPPGQENFVIIQYNPSDEYRYIQARCRTHQLLIVANLVTIRSYLAYLDLIAMEVAMVIITSRLAE
jgi:hypothetical protein